MNTRAKNGKEQQSERRQAARMMKRIIVHFRGQMDEKLRPQGVARRVGLRLLPLEGTKAGPVVHVVALRPPLRVSLAGW